MFQLILCSNLQLCFISLLHAAVFSLIPYADRTSLLCDSKYLIVYESGESQLVGQTLFETLSGQWFMNCHLQNQVITIGSNQTAGCIVNTEHVMNMAVSMHVPITVALSFLLQLKFLFDFTRQKLYSTMVQFNLVCGGSAMSCLSSGGYDSPSTSDHLKLHIV